MGEYTKSLADAVASRLPGASILVAAEEGIGEAYVDGDSGARVVPAFRSRDPASYRGVLDALAEAGGVDVLHVQHEYGIFGFDDAIVEVAAEAKRERLASATVITMHTVYHPFTVNGEQALSVQQSLIDGFDAIVVHLPIQSFELQAQDVPVGVIHRIPHGTSVNPFLGEPRRKLAAALGLDESLLSRFILVAMGFLRRDKGLDTLLDAVEEVGGDGPLVVVAGEARDEELAAMLRAAAGEGKILFIEKYLSQADMLRLAALSDAIVLPYRDPPGKYAASGVLHQSMGSLKPVLGTGVPRLSELYQLAPRLVFKPGDSEALARLLAWIARPENYDLAVAYASPVYSYAVRTSWPRVARRHIELYQSILQGRRPSIA